MSCTSILYVYKASDLHCRAARVHVVLCRSGSIELAKSDPDLFKKNFNLVRNKIVQTRSDRTWIPNSDWREFQRFLLYRTCDVTILLPVGPVCLTGMAFGWMEWNLFWGTILEILGQWHLHQIEPNLTSDLSSVFCSWAINILIDWIKVPY